MPDNVKFLETIHGISAETKAHIARLEELISAASHGPVKLFLMEVQSTLKIQDHLISKLTEMQLEFEDRINAIADKFDPQK